jgi:hypothetical protein
MVLFMAALALVGCLDSAPEVAASRKFMKALIVRDLDDLQSTVIPERREEIVRTALLSFGGSVLIQELTHGKLRIGYSGLKFHPLQKDRDESLVEVLGKVSVYYRDEPITSSFRFNLRLQKRDKHWLVSDVAEALDGR